MTTWRDTVLDFSALPEVSALVLSPIPAWIWSRDGSRCLWANVSGGRVLGAASFRALCERRWPENHALRRAIASLARAIPAGGMLARLRLAEDLHALPIACRCSGVRIGEERGVLIVGLEALKNAPPLGALTAFFGGAGSNAAVLDAAGAVLAETKRGAAAAIGPATPYLEFDDSGRTLRLYLIERAPQDEGEPGPPTPVFDNAGLTIKDAAPRSEALPEPAPVEPPPSLETPLPAEPPPVETSPPVETRPVAKRRALPVRDGAAERPKIIRPPPPAPPKRAANDEAPSPSKMVEAEKAPARSVMAGRVAQELARKPVRFLWQTDAADRFLFVSPGLAQVVGRNSDIVGERWQEIAARLRVDPGGRIARALRQHDTWSGLNAWWPIEGSKVRVPVELTALPVFDSAQLFQGYRGFGILRPAEALMPGAFEARFGPAGLPPAEQIPPYEEAVGSIAANVVPIRSDIERVTDNALTQQERNAFEEIAAALRDRVVGVRQDEPQAPEAPEAIAEPAPEPETPEPVAAREAEPVETPAPEPEPRADPAERDEAVELESAPPPKRSAPREIVIPKMSPHPRAPAPGAQLAESERRLREMTAILDTATDGVIILDANGAIESVNSSAEALFGLEAHEMEGRKFGELLTPESRKLALDYLSGLKDSGVASLLNEGREVDAAAGAGVIPLFMTMGRISSEEGGRFCAVLRDITHWKRIESELRAAKLAAEEASQQKSEFLARVSHEIRTPLNAIIGFAELMSEERYGPVPNERYREYLRDIRTSGEHVVSLVNDLLDISKIEAGKLDLTFAAVPLNEVVRESIALMQPQANRARVVLRSSLSKEVPAIVADERTLRQIVLNLLSNSVKFTGPGGQVIASTSLAESGEALLRIRDTGEGMSEEELKRALEPFRQLATTTMGGPAGTGLGLPLTKALVEANRATLSIKSARGEGTVVTVTIPATRVLSE